MITTGNTILDLLGKICKNIMRIALSFNRCLKDAVRLDEMWGMSVKEVVTVSPSDARLLIPSAPLSSDCLICKISVCIVLEAAVLECAGSCSYNNFFTVWVGKLFMYHWPPDCKAS